MASYVRVTINDSKLRAMITALPRQKIVRYVADGVEYGLYNELGTEKMSAQPFMRPATEAARRGFTQAFRGLNNLMQLEAIVEKAAHDIERGAKMRARVDTGAMKNSIHVAPGRPS